MSPDGSPHRAEPRRKQAPGTFRLGTVAGIDVTVANSWFLIVALIAIVMAPRIEEVAPDIGAWSYVVGAAFAVLLYGSVLLHEISHALAARAFEMPVDVDQPALPGRCHRDRGRGRDARGASS